MKKMITMMLALVLVLSLCACGADEPTRQKNEPSMAGPDSSVLEEIPQVTDSEIPNLSMFVGKWNYMPDSSAYKELTFTINADGTLEQDGEVLDWTAVKAPSDRSYEMYLEVDKSGKQAFTLYLTRTPENTYVAKLKTNSMGAGYDYYRESDYRVVELTKENMMEYLQCRGYYSYTTTDFGYTRDIYRYTEISFKEGVGYPSFCLAEFTYQISEVEVTFDEKPEGYTEGAVINTYEKQPKYGFGRTPEVTSQYPYQSYCAYIWPKNEGGETLTEVIQYWDLIGAQEIIGRVYIPQ